MMFPTKMGAQPTLPRTKQKMLRDNLGKYVAWDANMVARIISNQCIFREIIIYIILNCSNYVSPAVR